MKPAALLLFSLLFACVARAESKPATPSPIEWSKRMADAQITRSGDTLSYKPGGKWDYASNVFALALLKLGDATSTSSYADFVKQSMGSFVTADGQLQGYPAKDYSLDNVNGGKVLLELFQRTGDERYRKAAAELRAQLDTQPRTSEGGFWHKQRYPNQMWLDGLYMAEPFYADYAQRFGDKAALSDIAKQFRLIVAHTFDAKSGLYFHGWDEKKVQKWANPETGASRSFWSRGIGWFAMALVDTLDFIPADHPAHAELVALLNQTAAGIAKYQDAKSGLWWQVTDQGDRKGNYLEATASSMFTYALAKGVNRGWLPAEKFAAVAHYGYEGIVRGLVKTGADGSVSLIQCCKVAGLGPAEARNGTFAYYISEPIVENDLKGVGPFVLAGIEIEKLQTRKAAGSVGWDQLPEILARIVPPKFADRDFSILEYGAVADGKTDCTAAIRKAIAACHEAGGGRVVVPKGAFSTGAIHLLSNVNLHVSEGATLLFQTDPKSYLPVVFTRWEGTECMNYSPLIYAFEQENIAVTGTGTLDGQADKTNWWSWNLKGDPKKPQLPDRNQLMVYGDSGTPVKDRVFGAGHFLRPNFIQPYRCKNVLIEGVTILRSPMWEVHPVLSNNVTVRGVKINSHGGNNDGCDPESCRDVLIEDCVFDTGDDCIAIKSGRNADGRRVAVPSENIIVRKCVMKDGHGGVTIGSEISGDCRNVFIENCQMDSPELDRALRLKTNATRGGVIENVFMRNVEIGHVGESVVSINFNYEEGEKGDFLPTVRHIVVENVRSQSSNFALKLGGFKQAPIRDVEIRNCVFSGVKKPDEITNVIGLEMVNVKIERKE